VLFVVACVLGVIAAGATALLLLALLIAPSAKTMLGFTMSGCATTVLLVFAYYRVHSVTLQAGLIVAAALLGFIASGILAYRSAAPSERCAAGREEFDAGRYSWSVYEYSTCLIFLPSADNVRATMLLERANVRSEISDFDNAVRDWEAAFAIRTVREWRHSVAYAYALRKAGRATESLDELSRAGPSPASPPFNGAMLYREGSMLFNAGEHARAVAVLGQSLAWIPDGTMSHWRRGLAYEKLGDLEKAKGEFEETAFWLLRKKLDYSRSPQGREVLAQLRARLKLFGLSEKYQI
jgi:tetratricopeptide (TPR) repeat protein